MAIRIPYPVIDMKKTGANIKRLREAKGISVTDIQSFLGLSNPQAIYQWQRGISLPTVDHLCALSFLLETPMNDILILTALTEEKSSEAPRLTKRMPTLTRKILLLTAA